MHNCVQRSFTSAACSGTHAGFSIFWFFIFSLFLGMTVASSKFLPRLFWFFHFIKITTRHFLIFTHDFALAAFQNSSNFFIFLKNCRRCAFLWRCDAWEPCARIQTHCRLVDQQECLRTCWCETMDSFVQTVRKFVYYWRMHVVRGVGGWLDLFSNKQVKLFPTSGLPTNINTGVGRSRGFSSYRCFSAM